MHSSDALIFSPSLFGIPLVVSCTSATTCTQLYQMVWEQVTYSTRLLSPTPTNSCHNMSPTLVTNSHFRLLVLFPLYRHKTRPSPTTQQTATTAWATNILLSSRQLRQGAAGVPGEKERHQSQARLNINSAQVSMAQDVSRLRITCLKCPCVHHCLVLCYR